MSFLSLITTWGDTTLTIRVGSKTINVICTSRAINALSKRERPLLVEIELVFACVAHKQVRFPDRPPPVDAIMVNTQLALLTTTLISGQFDEAIEILLPFGKLVMIDDPGLLDFTKLKNKSKSLHWELMFTRSMYATPDMIAQHHLLNEVSALVDAGMLQTTMSENCGKINAANLKRAHAIIESGSSRGKIVLEEF